MRLTCPSCGAEYELPETLFLTGARKVRCVKCQHAWMAGERSAEPAAAAKTSPSLPDGPGGAASEPGGEAGARRPLPLRRRPPVMEPPAPAPEFSLVPPQPERVRTGRGAVVAWAASLLLLATAGWAGWEYRADVKAAWPASARLYSALGG